MAHDGYRNFWANPSKPSHKLPSLSRSAAGAFAGSLAPVSSYAERLETLKVRDQIVELLGC